MKKTLFAVGCAALLCSFGCSPKEEPNVTQNPPPPSTTPIGGGGAPEPSKSEPPKTETKPLDTSKMTKTASGLMYEDVVIGKGETPKPGQEVAVHYTGTLTNGTKFDSSLDRGEPIRFPLGAGRVIKGWDEGIASMKVGGKRKLVIPPELGYGSQDMGDIPPNSTLLFDVELVEIK
jgi:peptidylprolyl isomerase